MKDFRRVNVAIIILLNERKEVLLQKKDLGYPWFPGKWCLFGGGIERGEGAEETLKREIREELGDIGVKDLKFFKLTSYRDEIETKIREGEQHVFVGIYEGPISKLRIKEGCGFAFFSIEELNDQFVVDHDLEIIKDFYSS
ncbi:MAG: NUDIX hydrolase [Nanoarchaeota archaeon]